MGYSVYAHVTKTIAKVNLIFCIKISSHIAEEN